MFDTLYLTPASAALIFFVVVVCGHGYRKSWKAEPPVPRWHLWAYGVPAAIGLLTLAFLPLKG
ncbi:hypothetical protein KBY23_09470 [Ruegeria pomeroyi]|uniref:Uncharacterized protein n=1 Tax=Ruegeria alba TaxID=2916756 RepID=A0ABS9P0A1_9RHOB|nr:hypothetical protein [Ruegeria alba]MCE8516775.1 hypothetical protein [Ruegeria pomeroyi]MCE8525493.1 hypothetical protein [Ruegeria pomeroyi]MCE8556732.1 hypothetical protein [Ruegeria pomeroyi]MCG6559919.1 hypothetical protein [Ruegeria alba]